MSKESAISAIERGDLSELCHVLEESEWDIRSETLDSKGQSALHIACTSGHLDIVQYLVTERKCSVTLANINGHTPLLLSLIHKYWKIADFLLQYTALDEQLYGITRSFVSKMAKEALHESHEKGHVELLRFINARLQFNPKGEIPIEKARLDGALHHVKYLIKVMKCTIPDDMSDIHVACIVGDVEKVKSALDSNGQSILSTTDRYGTAAIHYAACELSVLHMIVGIVRKDGHNNCMLNLRDKRGNTVLHYCIMSGCTESVKHVIRIPGCNMNQLNVEGDAPLHLACKLKNIAVVQLLISNERCDLNIRNRKEDTALHIAAYVESNSIMVKCLLRSDKCDLNQVNSEHETPLHVACKHGHFRVVEMLVADENCDPFIQDINGDTALYAAVSTETQKDMIVQLLLCSCRCDLTDKGMRCTNELNCFIDLVFSGITAVLEMSDYHVIIQGRKDKRLTLKKGASLNTFKMLLHHIANCNSLCSNSLLLQIPNPPLYEHTDTSYDSYNIVNLRVQINTFPNNEQNKTLVVEYKGIDGCLSYKSDQGTLLHAACRSGYSAMAAALLKYGGDVQALDRDGNTACHIACHNLQFNCLRLLGEHLNQLNADGDTVLHILCGMEISKEKLPNCVMFLRETKALNINKFNKKGVTPLHIACLWSSGDVVQNLVSRECDVNACDTLGNTALHIAVNSEIDRLKKVQCLLESDKCYPNVRNKCGRTPLHAACRERNIEVLEKLVTDQRCDVNIQDDNGNTPLHTAIYAWGGIQLKNVQMLLGCKRCDPNQQNANGDTALHIVSRMILRLDTKLQYLQLLLSIPGINLEVVNNKHLASFDVSDEDGNNLLHNACAEGKSEMVQLLIENGADVLRPNRRGNAPIHIACKNFRLDILRILLNCNHCDPNQQDEDGDTALHIVCRIRTGNELEYLKSLLSAPGVDIQQSDRYENAPIHIACQYSTLDILKVILGHKTCDPNQQNADGDTPLHIMSRMTLSVDTKLQYLQLFLSTPGINLEVLNKDGNTPFHNACTEGEYEMVQFLIENGADVLRPNRHGNAPRKCSYSYSMQ